MNRRITLPCTPESMCDGALVALTAVTPRIGPFCPTLYEAGSQRPPIPRCVFTVSGPPAAGEGRLVTPEPVSLAGSLRSLMQTSPTFFFYFFIYLFHSQEALTVFKEAIQKMPRQFAPQSLYNMMGKFVFKPRA